MTGGLGIALLQLRGRGYDRTASLEHGLAACRRASAEGADVALFPELWSTGYTFRDDDLDSWRAQAVGPDDPWVLAHGEVAAELGMAVAVTYLERTDAGPRNTLTLFDRRGRRVLTYAKVHVCSFDLPEQALVPGEEFPVARLETAAGEVTVGAMICFDREFPEAARALALHGAELILVPNACELEANRLGQVRARAFENMAAVAVANYAAPDQNGHSTVADPVAFDAEGRSRDTRVFEAGEAEDVHVVCLDLEALRAWRETEVWGAQCRRPGTYGVLVEGKPDAGR
ncbi:MAG: carbon-nitrogen hydrolase family protein [Actinobacteria bacterium]|nr:carbon-nitrogen hydrolase family protein [Actinomycetota bacterium]